MRPDARSNHSRHNSAASPELPSPSEHSTRVSLDINESSRWEGRQLRNAHDKSIIWAICHCLEADARKS